MTATDINRIFAYKGKYLGARRSAMMTQPSLSVVTIVNAALAFTTLNLVALPAIASDPNLADRKSQNVDLADPNTTEKSESSVFFENSSPAVLRKQYGKHAKCFNWYDNSPLDEGQQEVDGYCLLEGITPELDFQEAQANTDIVFDNQDSQSGSSSTKNSGQPRTSSRSQTAQSGSNKSVRLPGNVSLPKQENTFSVISKSAFALPWSWKLGIILTISTALTVALEQKNR